jgi:hypothetical protein
LSLLAPWLGALLLAATLLPLVALYILRLRRVRRSVSSTIPWVRRTDDLRANAPFQRLRPSWLLLVQALLLALLALALAQPVLRGLGWQGGRVVLLVDCSASMRTLDAEGGGSRLEQARRLAVARAESLQGGGLFAAGAPEIMVISFAGSAEVRTPFTASLSRVREAIESITPTDERTLLAPALELARAHQAAPSGERESAAREPATLELFSDGRIADAGEASLRASERLAWTCVGSAVTRNAGLSAVGLERSIDDPSQVEAFAALRDFADEPVERMVELRADGALVAATPQAVQVPAPSQRGGARMPGERRVTFPPFASATQRLVEVVTQPGDAFATDDRALVAVREARLPSIALVGADDSLDALVSALPTRSVTRLDRAAADAAIAKDARWAESFDVVVSAGAAPRDMTRGRWLHFGAVPELPGLHPFGEAGRDFARTARGDHPALAQCNLNELVVRRAHRVAAESGWTALIEGGRAPLALAGRTGQGYAILVTFEPGDSNWPFQRSFVNFAAQAIDLLAGMGEVAGEPSVEPGAMIRVRVPDGARDLVVTTPAGVKSVMQPLDGEASWGPARTCGAYRIAWTGRDGAASSRWVVVNQLDPAECDVAAARTLSIGGAQVTPRAGGSTTLEAWPLAAGAALVLLLLEWWLYHRQASR